MKKGQMCEGIIEYIDFPNKGRVKVEDQYVTVKNGIPGQKIRFVINKKRKDRCEGRLLEVLEKSPLETIEPVCHEFPACGGCMYQTMGYDEQLKMKAGQVKKLLDTAISSAGQVDAEGKPDYVFEGITGSPKQWAYRNKMEFSFGDDHLDGPLTLGLHKKASTYDILTVDDCKIVHDDFTAVLKTVLDYFTEHPMPYYKKMKHTGYLRHLLVRRSETTREMLVHLVTTSQEECDLTELTQRLLALQLEGRIVGIMHIINDTLADVVQSDETRQCLWMDAVSWRIKDDIIRLIFNSIQHFQNVTGNEFTVVQLVQSGIDFGCLDSFFHNFYTDNFLCHCCQNLGNGTCSAVKVENSHIFGITDIRTGNIVEQFSPQCICLEE